MSEGSDNSVLFTALLITIIIPVLLGAMGATFGESMTGQSNEVVQESFLDTIPPVLLALIPNGLFLFFLPLTITLAYLPFWLSFGFVGIWLVMITYLFVKIVKDIIPFT